MLRGKQQGQRWGGLRVGSGRRGTRRAGKSSLSMGYPKLRARLHVALGLLSSAVLPSDTPGQTPKSPLVTGESKIQNSKARNDKGEQDFNGKGPRDPNFPTLMVYDLEQLLNFSDPQFPYLQNKNTNISFAEPPPAKEHQECTLCPTELVLGASCYGGECTSLGISGTGLYQNYSGTLAHVQ